MNGDIDYNLLSKFIDCDISGCNNEATEIIYVKKDALHTDKLYLCGRCKEEW